MTKKDIFSQPKNSAISVPSVAKNPFNQRNLRLINDLRLFKALYNCKETFTDVMKTLQIKLFMQNKPKFRKSQMNVNKVLTKDYENRTLGERGKKQSQTNPNKAKLKKAKMNVTSILTKDYENKSPFRPPKKQSQTMKRQKTMQTSLPQRITKKTVLSGSDKTNPKQTQPVVSLPALTALPALPALSAVEGSAVEGVEPISKPKKRGEKMSIRKDDQAKR